MKNKFFFLKISFVIFLMLSKLSISYSAIGLIPSAESLHKMNSKEIEKKLDRKMNFKERIAFSLFKKKQKRLKRKNKKKSRNASGVFAIVFGVLGFIPFIGILFSIASIFLGFKSFNHSDESAKSKRNILLGGIAIILGLFGLGFHIYFFAVLFP
ncbi:MAG: hypothetical protein AB8F94_04410 [Saprospiraceae bacterium]